MYNWVKFDQDPRSKRLVKKYGVVILLHLCIETLPKLNSRPIQVSKFGPEHEIIAKYKIIFSKCIFYIFRVFCAVRS